MSEELKQLEIKAENGDVDSQMSLGDHYRFAENNLEKAIKYYSMAAKQGNIKAYVHLAMYYSSNGDSKKSKEYYLKAAEGGNSGAQSVLGFIYYEDEHNNEEAFKWFKFAADNGDADAQYEVAEFYYMGRVEKNWKEAARYCRMAAEQGHEKAILKLDGFDKKTKLNISFKNIMRNFYKPWPTLVFNIFLLLWLMNLILHSSNIHFVLHEYICPNHSCSFFGLIFFESMIFVINPIEYTSIPFLLNSGFWVLIYVIFIVFLLILQILNFKWVYKILGVVCILSPVSIVVNNLIIVFFLGINLSGIISSIYSFLLSAAVFIPMSRYFFRMKDREDEWMKI